jgi:hypothetical protein
LVRSTTGLNVTVWGDDEPAVFVQGSFGWGEETWREERLGKLFNERLRAFREAA